MFILLEVADYESGRTSGLIAGNMKKSRNSNLSLRNSDTTIYDASEFSELNAENNLKNAGADNVNQYGFSEKKSSRVKKSRKKTGIVILFGVLAALIGIIAGVVCYGYWYKEKLLNKITYETKEPDAVVTIINEKGETVILSEVTQTTKFKPIQEEPIRNYLLIGIDSRENYYSEDGLGDRSDVIVVMSIDKKQGTIKLLSIPRDAYALFPGYENFHKINAAMTWGGPDLLEETVEECLRIEIDGYAYVNFNHMADIIDSVGGVYVDLDYAEMEVANDYIERMDEDADLIYSCGYDIWLNGIQAVGYARNRYTGDGEYERMEREIEVLRSIMDQFMDLSATEKLSALETVFEAVVTDIDKNEIEKLALEFLPSMKNMEMQYLQLPIEGCYNCGTYGDEWSMRVNWNAFIPYVQKYFYGRTTEFDEVEIPSHTPDIDDCDLDIPLEDLVH